MCKASFDEVPAMLDRQRRAFLTDGPPSVAVRRDRIDRLMALLLARLRTQRRLKRRDANSA